MKMTRVFGVFFTLAATLAVSGAFGQIYSTSNFVELKKATVGTNGTGTIEDTSYVQQGKSFGFYAQPDAAFHPNYQSAGTISTGFTWAWDFAGATGFSKAAVQPAGATANFVLVDVAATAGRGTIKVTETVPPAFGASCTGTAFDFIVAAFPAPSFSNQTGADEDKTFCGGNADASIKFSLLSSGTPYFKYTVETAKGQVNVSTGKVEPVAAPTWTAVTGFNPKTVTPATPWTISQTAPASVGTLTAGADGEKIDLLSRPVSQTGTLGSYTLTIQKHLPAASTLTDAITVFKISLKQINGLISRKADYDQQSGAAGTLSYYPAVASTTTYQYVYVIKAPTTGPVFHIGNSKAN